MYRMAGMRNSAAAMRGILPAAAAAFPDQQSGIAASGADGGASGDEIAPKPGK
jgi:hypothetical protein